jgi:transposase
MWNKSKRDLVREHGVGRPTVLAEGIRSEIDKLLCDDDDMFVSEVLRRLRSDQGYEHGKTAVYEYVRENRPKRQQLPVVLFEGVPGEFGQHDFGDVTVTYRNREKERFNFYAGRLKYSRSMQVKITENQQIESVIRGMLSFADEVGGLPLINVWDRPKTVVAGTVHDERTGKETPVYNKQFEQFMMECGVLPEVCAPASGNQKGSVESLVKFVKHSFFYARSFWNREDLEGQLSEWLRYVNHERSCSATGEIPAIRLMSEQGRLRKLPFTHDTYGMFYLRTVGPNARISVSGYEYAVGSEWIGQNVAVRVFPEKVQISYSGKTVDHPRYPENGKYSLHKEQREELFVKPRGAIMAKRQILMDLCPEGEEFFTELVHKRPLGWRETDLPKIWDLFEERGERWMKLAMVRCVRAGVYGAEYLLAMAGEVAA